MSLKSKRSLHGYLKTKETRSAIILSIYFQLVAEGMMGKAKKTERDSYKS